MKIKELMEVLGKYDENEEIRICVTDDNGAAWDIQGITRYNDDMTLYIDCGWKEE